jgi:hypothetical protein
VGIAVASLALPGSAAGKGKPVPSYLGKMEHGRHAVVQLAGSGRVYFIVQPDVHCSNGTSNFGFDPEHRPLLHADGSFRRIESGPLVGKGGSGGRYRFAVRGRVGPGGATGTVKVKVKLPPGSGGGRCRTRSPIHWDAHPVAAERIPLSGVNDPGGGA